MDWYTIAYHNEEHYLRKYLEMEFDPYDYSNDVPDFLEARFIEFEHDEGMENYEIGEKWIEQASEEELTQFKEYILSRSDLDDGDAPGYIHLSDPKQLKAGWLVHFTDEPWSIEKRGFIYGHEDFRGIGLTTWKSEEGRKKRPGFNFAFRADSRYSTWAANKGGYGKHAVVFWSSGIEAYHSGDEEDQVIFWGPSVRKDIIFPIYNEGDWYIEGEDGRRLIEGREFDFIVDWVIANYRTLQQIKAKVRNKVLVQDRKRKLDQNKVKETVV